MKAIKFSMKGRAAYDEGRYERALKYYSRALRLNRSVEDTDAIARSLINLASTYRKLNMPKKN